MTEVMPLSPSWAEIILRSFLTVAAGSLIGINRELGGRAAGLRTSVLVGLAACLALIQRKPDAASRWQDGAFLCCHGYPAPSTRNSHRCWFSRWRSDPQAR
jgi:hypothetical protein